MGVYVSGRNGRRQKLELIKSLDVNRIRRDGCLGPDNSGYRGWLSGK